MLTSVERSLRARRAAHARWAREDRSAASERQRQIMLERFEREVDPAGTLPPAERAKRAANALSSHMAGLAYKASRSRERRAKARQVASPPLSQTSKSRRSKAATP